MALLKEAELLIASKAFFNSVLIARLKGEDALDILTVS